MIRTRGVMDFNLDSGDVAEVETAVESTLANWFGAFSHFVRSEAASSLSSARRLEDRRLQARAWAVSFDVFVYEQQLDNVTATVTDLRTAAAEARFAEWLQRELNGLGIGAGFSLFRFRELVDPYEVSISLISSTTTFTTSSTTTVTTSSSTTSSSSTSTTLFPLLLESAELTQGYSTLLLTFNERAMLTSYARRLQAGEQVLPPAEVNCGEVFTAATLALLGLEPTCRWVADGRNLEVKLGTSPTLTFSDTVETIDGALTTNAFVVVRPVAPTPSLRAAVFSNDPPAQPQAALLVSPLSVQACSEISASAATSAGAAARPFVSRWALGAGTTAELATELQAKVNSGSELSLPISQLELFTAVEAVKQRMGNNFYTTPIQLELEVSLTNWLGLSDQATAVVALETVEEPMPLVTPTSAVATSILNSEPVAFSVQTSYVDTSSCSGSSSSVRPIDVAWEYRATGGTWQDLAAAGLTDLDRRPGAVRFDGFVFAPGSAHEFRVTAQYQGASSAAQRQYVFSLTVLPPAAPVVRVVGPHTVAGACSFSLDASQSYDPSLPPPSTSGLVFEWSCVTASGASCGLNSPDLASAQLLVAGGQLIEGLYNFSVLARRSGETEGAVSVWPIEIANGALPPVSITVPWASDEAVSTQTGGHLGPATASVQGSAGCTVPETWAWTFVLVEETSQSPILAFLNTVASWSNGQLTLSTNDFPGGFLIPGRRYAYAVLQASSQEEMAALESGNLESLIQAEAQGAKTVKSDMFLADGPPSGGLVTVSPVAGYAVTDAFSGTTFAWYDEQVESLTYAFYLLPFTQNTTMTSDGNGGILLGATFETPTVDWTNVTSPFYWSALGGSFLQNVSDPQAAQWDVSVAVGAYVMAVVARDHLGAVSVSYAPGPLVEAPPGGVSPDLALASLDTAMSSGDESVILGALDSLSSVAIASNDTAELAAATEKKMEALDSAANVVGASSDSLSKFGEVAANMLSSEGSGGSAASPAVAERAAGALDTVLTAALDSQGVDPAAGTSLLKATSSVGNSFADGGSDSNVAKGARVSKLRVLFSKLGSALLQQLPAGATSQISTVEGGKGTEIGVVKENANAAIASGVSSKNSQVPGSVLGRRLQENACDSVAVQNTNFVASNPFNYLDNSLGSNQFVASSATVSTLEIKKCNDLLVRSDLDPPIVLNLQLNAQPENPPEGYIYEPMCVRLDEQNTALQLQTWTTDGVSRLLPATYNAASMECWASTGGGSYAAVYVLVPLYSTVTSTTVTSTRMMATTLPVAAPAPAADGGIVLGTALAGLAMAIVCVCIGWQAYVGNVSLKPQVSCQRVKDAMEALKKKPAKVGLEPEHPEPRKDGAAWEEGPKVPPQPKVPEVRTKRDAEEHFWDWANELAKSTLQQHAAKIAGQPFSLGQTKASTPTIPHRYSWPKPTVEKDEYFQAFAEELRESIRSGLPGMIAELPEGQTAPPPPPPPKRTSLQTAPGGLALMAPQPPPPKRPTPETASVISLPPRMENAERIDVRVDQAFNDWAHDFALTPVTFSPSATEKAPPPPPPRPPQRHQLPPPPPRPPGPAASAASSPAAHGAIQSKASPSSPPPPPGWEDFQLRNAALVPAKGGHLPLPPAPPTVARPLALSPPALKAGQLSIGLPKHVPLQPPLPKGVSNQSTSTMRGTSPPPINLPGTVPGEEGSPTPRQPNP